MMKTTVTSAILAPERNPGTVPALAQRPGSASLIHLALEQNRGNVPVLEQRPGNLSARLPNRRAPSRSDAESSKMVRSGDVGSALGSRGVEDDTLWNRNVRRSGLTAHPPIGDFGRDNQNGSMMLSGVGGSAR